MNKPWLTKYDPLVPENIDIPEITVPDLLSCSAVEFPQQQALTFQGRSWSFLELEISVDHLAQKFIELGLKKGQRVGIVLPNSSKFVICYFAILKAGGVVCAMNPHYTLTELIDQSQIAGITFLVGLLQKRNVLEEVCQNSGINVLILAEIPVMEGKGLVDKKVFCLNSKTFRIYFWDNLVENNMRQNFKSLATSNDAAIFQFSGGTTGTPKAAIGLHRNLVANTYQFRTWLNPLIRGQETVLAAIPLFHVYGMVLAMNLGIMMGANLVLIPNSRDIQDILMSLVKYHATIFPGVPNLYAAINRHPDVISGKYNLRSIKACISGSAPLPEKVKATFEALSGGKLLEGYGLSEAPTATHCNPLEGENRSGSIGLPLPNVECRIISLLNNSSEEMDIGEIGELVVRGPQVFAGYYQMQEETSRTLEDGWLHTGDIARMDNDGYFYLIDRKKDLIKVGGFQVWPREIEDVLLVHSNVQEVAVAGVPGSDGDEKVIAWIVEKEKNILNEEELISYCRLYLASYKVPIKIIFRSELPRTGVGKILRRELVREFIEKN